MCSYAEGYLKASNTGGGDLFGVSVSVSADTIVVGAQKEDGSGIGVNPVSDENAADAGAAHVFVRSGTTWSPQAYLKASNTGADDQFGFAVSVSGDTVAVGAYFEDGSGTGVDPASDEGSANAGAAYIFVRSGTTWSPQAYLKASNTDTQDRFGWSLAVSGDTLAVGAFFEDGSGIGVNPSSDELAQISGAAYVFIRSGTAWSPQAYLKASNTEALDYFGYSVAVSGNTVVAGSSREDGSGTGVNPASDENATWAGATYVFAGSVSVPSAPTGVAGVPGNAQVSVSFTTPESDGGSPITGYTATASPGGANATGASSPLVVSGLTNGVEYTFTVTATSAIGPGSASTPSAPVTPVTPVVLPGAFGKSAPANLATGQSTSPTLSWGASAGSTSYEYCYDTSNDGACTAWTSTGTTTSAGLSGLTAGTTYYWHVRALNGGGTTYAQASPTAFWTFTTVDLLPLRPGTGRPHAHDALDRGPESLAFGDAVQVPVPLQEHLVVHQRRR